MLAPGARLGPYEIVVPLGAGGMGEVYRARDPRLGREVAVKVLPDSVSADPDRLRRFEQEARAASALNHPNILTDFDTGAQDGVAYLVTELLEGETLRERLAGGALPVRKAVESAIQIAGGLALLAVGYLAGRGSGTGTTDAVESFRFTRLTHDAARELRPAISPGGEEIAYALGNFVESDIYLRRVGSENAVNLTPDSPGADLDPAFFRPTGARSPSARCAAAAAASS